MQYMRLIVPTVVLIVGSVTSGAARLKSIELGTDVTGDGGTVVNARETFDPNTPVIHGVVLLENVRANSVLRGAWISVDAITEPNYEIKAIELKFEKEGSAFAHVSLSRPTKGWPVGNYRLDVSLDNEPIGSKSFSILPAADRPPAPAPALREGRIYTHPAGFSFWYPTSWSVTNGPGMLQLVPADAATSPQGPLELFFLATESLAGQEIQEPSDERVVQYLDAQIKSLSPLLQYTPKPSPLPTAAGKGAVLLWQATTPDNRRIIARVFVTFVKPNAVILIGLGLQERLDARDKDLRDLFQSITTGQARAPSSAPVPAETRPTPPPEPPAGSSPTGPAGSSIDQQLKALEAAKEAGVLSEQEYAVKKADLERKRTPAPDPETAKRLEALQAAHQAGVLTDEEYARKKAQLEAEPSRSAPPAGPQAAGQGLPAPIGGKTYRHVIGFSFWYPADWTVKELPGALQLVPPNPGTTPNGEPTEAYFVLGDTVGSEAISRADDPQVVQYLDQAMARIAPALRRTAAPRAVTTGAGTVMNWEGSSAGGQSVGARAYVSIINNYGVALVALCFQEKLAQRDAVVQRIFASFAFGSGQLDQRLCGKWTFLTTRALTNWSPFETAYSRANMASDTTGTLVLQPDGTWARSKRTHMIAGAGGTFLESDDTKTSKGRWNAGNGALYLIADDNSWEDYKYEIRPTAEGVRLLLTSGQQGELWERAN